MELSSPTLEEYNSYNEFFFESNEIIRQSSFLKKKNCLIINIIFPQLRLI